MSEGGTPPPIGRAAELGALESAYRHACRGRGRLVALSGPAGIGKTHLVEAFAERAGLPPGRVLWGRCLEQSGALAYWPWIRVVRAYAARREPEAFHAELADDAALGPFVSGAITTSGPTADAWGTEPGARFALFEAFAAWIRRSARSEPLLVVLEDVHWADEASLALLEFIASELDGSRCLLVVTHREQERRRPSRPLLLALRHGQRIVLRELDRAAVHAIVARAVASEPDPRLVDHLLAATNGNPFFLTEVLGALEHEGRLHDPLGRGRPLTLPETVRESIRMHVEPLAEEDRELMAVAAVIGEEFDVTLLHGATRLAPPVILQRLHGALELGLVKERPVAGTFRFAHALVRETIYGDLSPATRMDLHAKVADTLEHSYRDDADAPFGTLAAHFLHAAPLGTAGKAAEYAMRAGRQAQALLAHHDAHAAYEQALVAASLDGSETVDRLALRLAAAEAAWHAGLDDHAVEHFRHAIREARARRDLASSYRGAFGLARVQLRRRVMTDEVVRVLEDLLPQVGDHDSTQHATLLGLLSVALSERGDMARAEDLSTAAIAMAHRLQDPRTLLQALVMRQSVSCGPDGLRERAALATEAVGLTERGIPDAEHPARIARFTCLLELGDVPEATRELERIAALAERPRRPEQRWEVLVSRATLALLQGRWDDAARLAAEALAVRQPSGDPTALETFVVQMFLARRDTGQHGSLEGSLRWMIEQHPDLPVWRCVLGVFLADLGRVNEARELFELLAADGFRTLRRDVAYPVLLCWLARICMILQDHERAALLYPLLEPFGGRNIVLRRTYPWACLGAADRYLGILAATMGQADRAEEHYRAAIELNERMGARPVLACVEHECARLLAQRNRPGDRKRAHDLLERARATSQAFDLRGLLGWIEFLGPIPAEDDAPAVPAVSAQSDTLASARVAVLRPDGEVWEIGFRGETHRLKDARGLHLLATLLRHPWQEIHALELGSGGPGAAGPTAVLDRGDAGPLLDDVARAAYKSRLEDLEAELDEAERFHDAGRVDRARHEMELLTTELGRGVGLGGRIRRAGSAAERARVNATRTIGTVIKRIGGLSVPLGDHLRASVRTGYVCVYAPDPTVPIRWEL